jgi:hypothetical protein
MAHRLIPLAPPLFFQFYTTFNPGFWKVSRTLTYTSISTWDLGGNILRKIISKPRFCSGRWSTSAQNLARFNFAGKKHTYSTDTTLISSYDVHECLSFRNKKSVKLILVFDLLYKPVFRIHYILVWIRGSMPPTNGSGSCYFVIELQDASKKLIF